MRRFLRLIGNLGIMILSFIAYELAQIVYVVRQGRTISALRIALIIIVTAVLIWGLYAIYKYQLKVENEWKFNQKPHWDLRRVFIAFGAFVLIVVMQIIFISYIGGNSTSTNQKAIEEIQKSVNPIFNLMLVVLAPICEELIFRGMFFNTFFPVENIYTKWIGIITSGFVFAFGHDPAMDKFIFLYWMMGSILAWTYVKTKDIRYSVLAHMLNNLLSLL
ncbi:type II CAAX endopeptidase family protein [Lactobacillus sp. PV034]|uniref:type II CAAX endopeptidase family protein n=1 Tax=Lactobacillus sp. PV034 TaxID=2594495 RepID=UPI00223E9B97|nr:type II CAAX endopeptidase family protein [Lactobacillus sp. PV034]QNQ81194.1 CPBP family intramembrane metalloprotease [Lactobacillus sp. PV034]